MKSLLVSMMIFSILTLGACSEDHEGLPTSFEYQPPPTPTGLEVAAGNNLDTLMWSYPHDSFDSLEEFRIYYYYEIYGMAELELVGTTTDTFFIDSLLIGNCYYCYKVSAVDTSGFEGWRTPAECGFVRNP